MHYNIIHFCMKFGEVGSEIERETTEETTEREKGNDFKTAHVNNINY